MLPLGPARSEYHVHRDAVEGVDYDVNELTQVWLATNEQDRRIVRENQADRVGSVDAKGQHNPGGAKNPWGSGVLENATRDPKCPSRSRSNRRTPSRSEGEHEAPVKLAGSCGGAGRARGNVRSRCLEAVLGETGRTEFYRGIGKREPRSMLIGHEAGNGGHSQAFAYGLPRRMSTRQIRMHGLSGGLDCFYFAPVEQVVKVYP